MALSLRQRNIVSTERTLKRLPRQFTTGWDMAAQKVLPRAYRRPSLLAVCGMGGSNLATELVQAVCGDILPSPLILVRDYALPAAVTRASVVIISSYSGDTAETLACYDQARERGARLICLTAGGELRRRALADGVPLYLLDKRLNPCGQPRYAIAVQVGALLGILVHMRLVAVHRQEVNDIQAELEALNQSYQKLDEDNSAYQAAQQISGRLPLLVAGEHLSANAHILANQLNESAKTLAFPAILPEFNHHGLEGLARPTAARDRLIGIVLTSTLYTPDLSRRAQITTDIMRRQAIPTLNYELTGNNPLAMALEVLLWGSWVSYYVALAHHVDPAAVPWVHYLKGKLS